MLCVPQFSFRSCKFRVQKSKEGTGRIVMWKLGIKNSYTMESTFGGSTLGQYTGCVRVFAAFILTSFFLKNYISYHRK